MKRRPVVTVRQMEKRPDLFDVKNPKPGHRYYHAKDDPMRVRQLELDGWWVCDGDEVIGSPAALKSMAKSGPLNLPGHVLMMTTEENYRRVEERKDARLKQHETDVKDSVDQVKAILDRSGLGRKFGARITDDKLEIH